MLARVGVAALAALALAVPAAASAAGFAIGVDPDSTPQGFSISGRQAIAAASRDPAVRKEASRRGPLRAGLGVPLGSYDWQVGFYSKGREVARASVDGRTGRLTGPVLTGFKIAWPGARGTKTPFRDRVDWTTLILCVLFLLPFVDPRRPFRILHLDLLALIGFEVSFLLLQTGHLYAAVPLQYVPALYLLARLCRLGFAGRESRPAGPLVPFASERMLLVGLVALVVARIVWNIVWSPVADVGYAGLVGADSILQGYNLYDPAAPHLDAYGPVNYLFYVPFSLLFPLGPGLSHENTQAAHLATITLDLAVIVLLMVVGSRLAGRKLALALGYAWAAFPFSFFPFALNANDAMVALAAVAALAAYASPVGTGAVLGLGAAAKFSPASLLPVLALGRERSVRRAAVVTGIAAAIFVLAFVPYVRQSGLGTVWDRTIGFQLDRGSPFTLWGLHPSLGWLHPLFQVLAAGVLLAAVWFPRERSLPVVAALSGAVLIALQMAGTYWAHTYVAWFAAPALVAIFARAKTATAAAATSVTSS